MGLFTSSKQAVEGFSMIPDPNFLLGHLPLMMEDDFRVSLYKFSVEHADENGRVCFWMGSTPALSFTRAKDVQFILKHSSHRTVFGQMKKHAEAFLGKRNIGMLTGKEWKTQRSAVVKAMHATANLQAHTQAVIETSQKFVAALNDKQYDDYVEIGALMKMLTLDTFGRAALNVDFGCIPALEPSEIAISLEYLTSEMMRRMTWGLLDPTAYSYRLPTPSNLKYAHHKKVVRGFIHRLVQERRDKVAAGKDDEESQDLLSELIKVHEATCTTTKDVAEETLTDTLVALLFAGYETTAATMTYVLYLLSQHELVEKKVLEEIQCNATSHSSDDYPYLKAVIMETLRLYPPAISTTRSLEKTLELDGLTIPEGTYLYVPIWTVQRDAHNFEQPEAFLPERWLACNHQDDGFVAFSAGARSCAGQRFAMMEMLLSLTEILRNCKFQAKANYELTPHRDGLIQTPKGGLPMMISCRESESL